MLVRSKPKLKPPIDYADRSGQSFAYVKEIVKEFGKIEHVLDWCKKELVNEWRWQLVELSSDTRPGRYIFYFDGEKDCLAFTMKWS
jgi:hypothetical protein